MADIRYVCLSDLHLGEEDSLMTNLETAGTDPDPAAASPVMKQLVVCLKHLIANNDPKEKPTLILNGDILELALCNMDQAAMAFTHFIGLTMPEGAELFKDIIFIPGNHDHHLWETAREYQYINHVRQVKPQETLEPPRHASNLFFENQKIKVRSDLLTNLMQRFDHLKADDKQISVFYPNLGIKAKDAKKCILFTHGHYFEPVYKLMTFLKRMVFPQQKDPLTINELEAENFAWIDFFWSTLGRSGQVGSDVEVIYEKLQYLQGLKNIVENLSRSLVERFDLPGWGEWMENKILNALLQKFISDAAKRERSDKGSCLGFQGETGFRNYVTGPLHNQIVNELGTIPEDVTIVFGHTHKPFQKDMKNFSGYPGWLNIYNTGGWVVETVLSESVHGGAVVLIDHELNATSLRMYNEADDPQQYRVNVEEARHANDKSNPFYEEINGMVNPEQDPWKTFSEIVASAVRDRAKNLHARAKRLGYLD